MIDAERFRLLSERLDDLLDLEPKARAQCLAAIAIAEPDLAREVAGLLAAAESAGPLGSPLQELAAPLLAGGRTVLEATSEVVSEGMGERATAGPFRLIRRLGEGGMGEVWLAERVDADFEQQVALKLVRPGLARPELEARLRRERAILARLEHPHIAHLIDGGVTEDSRLYFAMERVEGEPITDFCAHHALSVAARLALFLDVCAAVAYAHRRLVVHRDLKPSNVFVTAQGNVKLLDFGIAKLLAREEGNVGGSGGSGGAGEPGTVLTDLDERLMTPAYAAPEQILGRAVTTATDVYALGVLLYELLTHTRPFRAPSRMELERAIVDTEAKRPSALVRTLRGDLDAILLKALRKEPERRYPSVEALAEDLSAFLDGRPVGARGDAFGYRSRKFVGRHRAASLGAVVVVVALAGGLGVSLWQGRLARRAAARAQTVKQFLISTFGEARPEIAKGEETTAREILERGLGRIDRDLARDPDLQAEMLETVASIQGELGAFPKAAGLWQRAVALREGFAGGDADAVATARLGLAGAAIELGELDRAERAAADALAALERAHGAGSPRALEARRVLGVAHRRQGKIEQAESELAAVVEGLRRRLPEGDPTITTALGSLASAKFDAGKYGETEALFRELVGRAEVAQGTESLDVADALDALGVNLDEQEKNAEAEKVFGRSLAIRQRLLGGEHASVASSLKNLGVLYQSEGRFDEAVRALERAIAIWQKSIGPESYGVADATNTLGVIDYLRGDFESAERRLARVLEIWSKTLGPEHPSTLTVANNRAGILLEMGRLEEAEVIDAEVLSAMRRQGRKDDNFTAVLNVYGDILSQRGKVDAALAAWEEALALNRTIWGPESPILATGFWFEGRALRERGTINDRARAEELLRQGLALLEAHADPNPSHLANTLLELGRLDLLAGRSEDAEKHLSRALALRRTALGDSNWKTAEARSEWARALAGLGRRDEARREIDASLAVLEPAKPLRAKRACEVARRTRVALAGTRMQA